MSMGHILPRFRHQQGRTLSRWVAADSPLESCCIGHYLAAMAETQMFSDEAWRRVPSRTGLRGRLWWVGRPVSKTSLRAWMPRTALWRRNASHLACIEWLE